MDTLRPGSSRSSYRLADGTGPDGTGGARPSSLVPASLVGPTLLLIVLILTLMVSGCTDQTRIDQLEQQTQQVRDSLNRLLDEQQALRKESEERANKLSEANRLIMTVVQRLSELSEQEEALRRVMENAQSGSGDVETVEMSPDAENVRSAIETSLSNLENELEESRAAVARLEERSDELSGQLSSFKETAEQLTQQLAEKEETVNELRTRVEGLVGKLNRAHADNEALRDTTRQLRSVNEDLREAYVVTADQDSLEAMGILDRPLLGFLGSTKIDRLDPTNFQRVKTETTEIALPSDRDGIEIYSSHRYEPDLYEVDGDRLLIQDSKEFWALSRYLVVEVQR